MTSFLFILPYLFLRYEDGSIGHQQPQFKLFRFFMFTAFHSKFPLVSQFSSLVFLHASSIWSSFPQFVLIQDAVFVLLVRVSDLFSDFF